MAIHREASAVWHRGSARLARRHGEISALWRFSALPTGLGADRVTTYDSLEMSESAVPSKHVAFLGGRGVRYEERRPPAALAPWVAVYWRIETDVDFDLRIPPDGCMDIIGDDVVGSFSRFGTARLPAGSVSRGIRFHPGGFPALFDVPADELLDLRVPIADVRPRFRSLERLAADALPPDSLVRAVVNAADVRVAARESGYSERQLRRRIRHATGHNPKRLIRIARLQRLLLAGRGESWARSAVEHGYYDEAHMVNDVRGLLGATPHALLGA